MKKTKKKNNRFLLFLLRFSGGAVLILVMIALWWYVDGEGGVYLYLLTEKNVTKEGEDTVLENPAVNMTIEDILQETGVEQIPVSGAVAQITQNNHTTGTGLNLLLINSIPNNGYSKELLSILADHEEGKYGVPDGGIPVTLEAYLGLMANESGLIKGIYPKTYIPWDEGEDGTVKFLWNQDYVVGGTRIEASKMTLTGFNRSVFDQINLAFGFPAGQLVIPSASRKQSADFNGLNNGSSTIYTGPVQCNEKETANYNENFYQGERPVNQQGQPKRDFAWFLDDLWQTDCYMRDRVVRFFGKEVVQSLSAKQQNALFSTAHNRGNLYTMAFGWAYKSGSGWASRYDFHGNEAEVAAKANVLIDTVETQLGRAGDNFNMESLLRTDHHRWIAVISALESNRRGDNEAGTWFISGQTFRTMKGSTQAKSVFQWLVNGGVAPADNWYEIYASYQKTLAEGIAVVTGYNITVEECVRCYGCAGDYDGYAEVGGSPLAFGAHDPGGQCFGFLYFVRKERCPYNRYKLYDRNNQPIDPYWVNCWDLVVAGHNVAVSQVGGYVYERLLSYAGVTAGETRIPSSYVQVGDALQETQAKVTAKMEGAIVPTNRGRLEEWRLDLLEELWQWEGTPYAHGSYAGSNAQRGRGGDCTGFIYAAYKNLFGSSVKFSATGSWVQPGEPIVASLACRNTWEWIPYTELQPGDVIVSRRSGDGGGHAAVFLGWKEGMEGNIRGYVVLDSATTTVDGVGVRTPNTSRALYTGSQAPDSAEWDTWYCFRLKNNIVRGRY